MELVSYLYYYWIRIRNFPTVDLASADGAMAFHIVVGGVRKNGLKQSDERSTQ
jgi:hypothetical protein